MLGSLSHISHGLLSAEIKTYAPISPDTFLDSAGICFDSHRAIEGKTLPNLWQKLPYILQIHPYNKIEQSHPRELAFHSCQTVQ